MTNITPIPPITVAAPPGYRWIFCVSYVHWRSKKRVFRKNGGYFRFLVRAA